MQETPDFSLRAAGTENGAALYRVDGVLDFETVPEIFRQSLACFVAHGDIVVDLSGVTRTNSAGLALLLEWRRYAHESARTISFRNAPAALRNLARVSELEMLLSF
jgi:phospholipid transport system transporter-binding protein